jgi:hypothetical protein
MIILQSIDWKHLDIDVFTIIHRPTIQIHIKTFCIVKLVPLFHRWFSYCCLVMTKDNKYQRILQRICTSLVVKMCLFYIFILFFWKHRHLMAKRQRKCCCKMSPFIIINEHFRTGTYRLYFIGCWGGGNDVVKMCLFYIFILFFWKHRHLILSESIYIHVFSWMSEYLVDVDLFLL